jgi:hypothetical protein
MNKLTLEQKHEKLMEKIDIELQELAIEIQYKQLQKFLQRFNHTDYKPTLRQRQLLGVMRHQIDWVIKNCLGE